MHKGRYFLLRNPKTGLVMEVKGHQGLPGTEVVSATMRSPTEPRNHQLWTIAYRTGNIRSKLSNLYMTVREDYKIVLSREGTQKWSVSGGKICRPGMGDVLGIAYGSPDAGQNIVLMPNDDAQESQLWELVYTDAEYFHIMNKKTGEVLDIMHANKEAGEKVILFKKKDIASDNQLWYEDMKGIVRSKLNDFAITDKGESHYMVMLPYDEHNQSQQWTFRGDVITNGTKSLAYSTGTLLLKTKFNSYLTASHGEDDSSHWFQDYLQSQAIHHGMSKYVMLRCPGSSLVLTACRNGPGSAVVTSGQNSKGSVHSKEQLWTVQDDTIISAGNFFCLDIAVDGTLCLNPFDPLRTTQRWFISGKKILSRSNAHLVVARTRMYRPRQRDDMEQSRRVSVDAREEVVCVAPYNGREEQLWDISYVPLSCFMIKSHMNHKALTVEGGNRNSGTRVLMCPASPPDHPNTSQLWFRDEQNHGVIHSKLHGYVLDTSDGVLRVSLHHPSNDNQHWILDTTAIRNVHNINLVLDIRKRDTRDNAVVIPWKPNGQTNQSWYTEDV